MRIAIVAAFVALAAVAVAQTPPADPGRTAQEIQAGCVRRGEDARVCACGVGIAYAKLEPQAFALIPKIDPLIDEPDRAKQIGGLLSVASQSRMSVQQVQAAYETIRANRATVRQVCRPLAPAPATKK